MKTIKILGGGIAGLTAAINLKLAGVNVEVHERKQFCGKSTNDFQFLENWTFKRDALALIRGLNIQTDFYVKPWHAIEIIGPSLKRCEKVSSQPLMYLIKRGPMEGAIDHSLQKQAFDAGIRIIFQSKLSATEADIIATGRKNPNFIVNGVTFALNHPDKTIILLDDCLAQGMYAYFIVNDNIGQIAAINPTDNRDHIARFKKTVKRFEGLLKFKVDLILHRFSAPGSLQVLTNAIRNNRYLVGEAAGFQDCLAGFGMMYAFKSGYHAAQSVIEKNDYNNRWQRDMLKPIKVSQTNRFFFEHLGNNGYDKVIRVLDSNNPAMLRLLGGSDLRLILNRLYNRSLSPLLRPAIRWKKSIPLYRLMLSIIKKFLMR